MSKYYILAMSGLMMTGCASIAQQRKEAAAEKEFSHKVYIAVENARLHDEPANILGGKIRKAIEERKAIK